MKLKLKRVVIMRHGEDGPRGPLTFKGREQAKRMADILRSFCSIVSTQLATSPTDRAMETADIIAKRTLLGSFVTASCLYQGLDGDKGLSDALQFVREKGFFGGFDTLILVTHQPQCTALPRLIARDLLGLGNVAWGGELKHGEAWSINCTQRSYTKIEIPV